MAPGLIKDPLVSQTNIMPFPIVVNHQVKHQATYRVGSQPCDCRVTLILTMGLCGYVWINTLTSSTQQ